MAVCSKVYASRRSASEDREVLMKVEIHCCVRSE
jgi:hypothetical protein